MTTRIQQQIDQALSAAGAIEEESKEFEEIYLPEKVKHNSMISEYEELLNQDIIDDYMEARNTLRNTIERGERALDRLLVVAEGSEHPRAFEVVGGLIRTINDAAKQLLDLQKTIKELKQKQDNEGDSKQTEGNYQQNNYYFEGNMADMARLHKQMKDMEKNGEFIDAEFEEEDDQSD